MTVAAQQEEKMIRSKDPPLISGTQFAAIVVLTITLFLIIDLGRRTTAGYYVSQAEKKLKAEIRAELAFKQRLIERLEYVKTDAFVEQWAREQARMVRPGDRPLILVPFAAPSGEPAAVQPIDTASLTGPEPNWHHWWRLFFNSEPGTLRSG
jgi:cell division protein FtsB